MTYYGYLGELPDDLRSILTGLNGDGSNAFDALRLLSVKIEEQIEKRHEVALSLLDVFDAIEIIAQRSMSPGQKSEFCYHLYMRYFTHLVAIINAVQTTPANSAGIASTLPYLLAKLNYELERRRPVLEKGGRSEFAKILRHVRHLI